MTISNQDYAKLSFLVYNNIDKGRDLTGYVQVNGIPLTKTESGFFAQAYQNETTKEYVLVFRGTEDSKDLAADAAIIQGTFNQQFLDALVYARNAVNTILAIDPNATITVTGHSLGGTLAQLVAAQFDLNGGITVDALGAGNLLSLQQFAVAGFDFPFRDSTGLINYTVKRSIVPSQSPDFIGEKRVIDLGQQVSVWPILVAFAANPLAGLAILFAQETREELALHSSANIYAYFQRQTQAGRALTEVTKEFVVNGVEGYKGDGIGVSGFLKRLFGIVTPITQQKAEETIGVLEALKSDPEFSDPGNRSALNDLIRAQDQFKIATQDIISATRDNPNWTESGEGNELKITIKLQHTTELTQQHIRLDLNDTSRVGKDFIFADSIVAAKTRLVPDPLHLGQSIEIVDHFDLTVPPNTDTVTLTLRAMPDADNIDNRLNLDTLKISLLSRDSGVGFPEVDLSIHETSTDSQLPQSTRTIVGDFAPFDFDSNTPGIQFQTDDLGNIITDPSQPGPIDDTLNDSAGNDRIESGGGVDTINAFAGGDDYILAGEGDDGVSAGPGNDVVEAGPGSDNINGGAGDDLLFADAFITLGDALANGEVTGNPVRGDLLAGYDGNDTIIGGTDQDFLTGGAGDDIIVGGGGDDIIESDVTLESAQANWSATLNVSGTSYTVVHQNVTLGVDGQGADIVYAGGGDDYVSAGAGDDFVDGGSGADVLFGEAGSDTLLGGAGNDIMTGDNSTQIVVESLHGDDFLDGGAGDDILFGAGGNDTLFGGEGNDQLFGDAANLQSPGDDYLDGEAGDDLLVGAGGADTLYGGEGNDTLAGDSDDTPLTQQGDDELFGEDGNDVLQGYGGNDTLDGGAGDDTLLGGAGDDFVDCKNEKDWAMRSFAAIQRLNAMKRGLSGSLRCIA